MEIGLVQKVNIDEEMQQAYLDYAMSVIVARALPDARDGLKPVHRRILYAMYDMGLRPNTSYKKSARIVGEVLGKYHPHGDMAVYDAMARMAQDFSMRYLLVDGQGNFGSVDGDPPAAMRYTEARMADPAANMLFDINKNTVDFEDNFDGTLQEPTVLPAAIPNLLVNGATGIAVGMSTSIPPHNLSEVVDVLRYLLEKWEKLDDIDLEDLMRFVQGPDFPTGGVIIQDAGGDGLATAYGSGRGRVTVQARAHLEESERGRRRIVVTELPYMTNKAGLIERIATLVRDERLDGIVDLRDESDRHGMRIVIELNKSADPEAMLRDLYKSTPMQSTFSIIMLALVDGEPRMLSLKQALRVYVEHRLEIVRRRSEYDLEKARQRSHILEGLRVALKNLDDVIDTIRRSPDAEEARTRLMKKYKLSEIQAQAILDMPLRRLAALERKKIEEEYKEVQALIKSLEELLASPKKMRQVVSEELAAVKEAYGDKRRTQIIYLKEGEAKASMLTATDLIEEKTVWVSLTEDGLLSRSSDDKLPRLSGRDVALQLVKAGTRDTLYLVAENGEAAAVSLHNIPEAEKPSAGTAYTRLTPLSEADRPAALFSLAKDGRLEDWYVLTATRQGMVKKSSLSELPGPSSGTFTLVKVNPGDRLGWLRLSDGKSDVLMVTEQGMSIRFSEEEVRPMGLVAAGVMGIKLQEGDAIAGMELLPQVGHVFLAASDGTAKRVAPDEFSRQGRYGAGLIAWKLPKGVRVAGLAAGKGTARATLHLTGLAPKQVRLDEAPLVGRTARGSSIQDLKGSDRLVAVTLPWAPPRPGGWPAGEESEPEPEPPTPGRKAPAESDGSTRTRRSAAAKKDGAPTAKAKSRSKASSATAASSDGGPAAKAKGSKKAAGSRATKSDGASAVTAKGSKKSASATKAKSDGAPEVKAKSSKKAAGSSAARSGEPPAAKAKSSRKAASSAAAESDSSPAAKTRGSGKKTAGSAEAKSGGSPAPKAKSSPKKSTPKAGKAGGEGASAGSKPAPKAKRSSKASAAKDGKTQARKNGGKKTS